MNLFGMMEISGSALRAERVRAEVVATNMANAETTRTADGGAYNRKRVLLASAESENSFSSSLRRAGSLLSSRSETFPGGVDVTAVENDTAPPVRRYDPSHPDADKDGFVAYPDINPLTEMVDLMGATRSYGLNATALQAEKGMVVASLDILK
jgi:flagellar basal-body rod protein FlgC